MAVKKRSKKKTGATRKPEQSSSRASWFFIVLLVGSFTAFLVYLDQVPTEPEVQNVTVDDAPEKATKKQPQHHKPKAQFDFYTVLPDREVEVNKIVTTAKKNNIQSQKIKYQPVKKISTEKKSDPASLYQLQVGAFKELAKADAMKARLAFIGVESNIQVIQNKGQKMYRVRIGPSTDEKKINRIKQQLKAQSINTYFQKLKG